MQSGTGLNDGRWHHVVASLSPAGMALYVDGVLVGSRTDTTTGQAYNGFLRVGGDSSWSGASYFAGSIDEVALYPTALSADRVGNHFSLGSTGRPTNVAPTAGITSTVDDLAVAFDGTRSRDTDGTVASYAWDFGDGTTGTGATPQHTYAAAGTYTVALTVTDDAGAATAGPPRRSPWWPTRRRRRPSPPARRDLAVSVDGTASTDTDGTVAAYGWNWGDGSADGTGKTAAHTYAAAGTYTVTLTVTDNDGATHTTSQQVTVTAPIPTAPIAKDTFGRSVTGGLGTADVGGAWTVAVGAARQSVTDGVAELALPGAGNNTGSYLGSVSTTSADLRTSFTLTAAPTGTSGTWVYVTGRRTATGDEYRVRVRVAADGAVYLALSRVVAGVEAFPGGEVLVPGLTWTPGTTLASRVQVSGTGHDRHHRLGVGGRPGRAHHPAAVADRHHRGPAGRRRGRSRRLPARAATPWPRRSASAPSGSVWWAPVRTPTLAPTAAFTAAPRELSVAVDASGSADADGRVTRRRLGLR